MGNIEFLFFINQFTVLIRADNHRILEIRDDAFRTAKTDFGFFG
jgi:hypothetical protein